MDGQQEISVVVATYNRSDILPLTLRHLAEQTLSPSRFEVIVVDDGSPDRTESVIRELEPSLPFRLVYMRHDNKGPGYTQNKGIREAGAPLVHLIADDILLTPPALEAILDTHRAHPEPNVVVLGKVLQSRDLGHHSVFLKKWNPFKFHVLESCEEVPYPFFWACNISCKRRFLLENGLFREEMGRAGAASHEDVELGYRLHKAGLRILYNKKALGYHHHVETLDGAIRRAYQRGINWKEFRERVDDPSITVRYNIYDLSSVGDHFKAFRKDPRELFRANSNPFRILLVLFTRHFVFNGMMIKRFWLPLMGLAEEKPWLARLMHTQFYRCVINHHFNKGVSDGRRM